MRELEQLAQHVIDLRSATNLNEASLAALEQANQALEAELAQCKTLLEQARTELHDIRQASPLPAADNVDAIAAIYGVR
jgi:chromosome segregation ATPase